MPISAARVVDTAGPLAGPGRWTRVVILAVLAGAGVALAWTAHGTSPRGLLVAGGLILVVVAATLLPWSRWPDDWQALPAMGYFGVAGVVAHSAGIHADLYLLAGPPVLWLALFHTRRMTVLGLGVLAVVLLGPPLWVPAAYPGQAWQDVAMAFVLLCLGGLTVQGLISRPGSS